MATIVLRGIKGSPLTTAEMDTNFSNLNNSSNVEQLRALAAEKLLAPLLNPIFTGNITLNVGTGGAGKSGISVLGGTAPAYLLNQDGTGRQHWYWNTAGGSTPTFVTSNEDANDIMMNVNNISGNGGYFQFRTAPGFGKNSGNTVNWTNVLYADMLNFYYMGSQVMTNASLVSYNFTGLLTAPTPPATSNGTQIATTAYVTSAVQLVNSTLSNTITNTVNSAISTTENFATNAVATSLLSAKAYSDISKNDAITASEAYTDNAVTTQIIAAGLLDTITDSVNNAITISEAFTTAAIQAFKATPGIVGPTGPQGAASTIAGPVGPQGAASTIAGPVGPQGAVGPQGDSVGLGVGQNWYNTTANRKSGVIYYNTLATPIVVNVSTNQYSNWSAFINADINGASFSLSNDSNSSGGEVAVGNVIVPAGQYYAIITFPSMATWFELR
jgi:hypothetical protein